MEWGAERILALRKHAGMTQAQIAQWLGVTIKQVKYLEHQRRNPSGPTRRLLSILAAELKFDRASPFQVVGASATRKTSSKPSVRLPDPPPPPYSPSVIAPVVVGAAVHAVAASKPVDPSPPPPLEVDQSPEDGAFAWQ